MRSTSRAMRVCGGLLAVLAAAVPAGGEYYYYDDLTSGANLDFLNIYEETRDDARELFGQPSLIGTTDRIRFSPTGFYAQAAGEVSNDTTESQLMMTIAAKGEHGISKLTWRESGSRSIAGSAGTAYVSVGASAPSIAITEYSFMGYTYEDYVEVSWGFLDPSDYELAVSPKSYFSLAGGDLGAGSWTGLMVIDIDRVAQEAFGEGAQATRVDFVLTNTLQAGRTGDGSASIDKTSATEQWLVVDLVPEPGSLTVLALGAIALFRHRRAGARPR